MKSLLDLCWSSCLYQMSEWNLFSYAFSFLDLFLYYLQSYALALAFCDYWWTSLCWLSPCIRCFSCGFLKPWHSSCPAKSPFFFCSHMVINLGKSYLCSKILIFLWAHFFSRLCLLQNYKISDSSTITLVMIAVMFIFVWSNWT